RAARRHDQTLHQNMRRTPLQAERSRSRHGSKLRSVGHCRGRMADGKRAIPKRTYDIAVRACASTIATGWRRQSKRWAQPTLQKKPAAEFAVGRGQRLFAGKTFRV